jgi:hypothetical protein
MVSGSRSWQLRASNTGAPRFTALLPYLSRYMGHATFDSTYYYVHTSPDFIDAYAEITRQSQALLPEVGFQ